MTRVRRTPFVAMSRHFLPMVMSESVSAVSVFLPAAAAMEGICFSISVATRLACCRFPTLTPSSVPNVATATQLRMFSTTSSGKAVSRHRNSIR